MEMKIEGTVHILEGDFDRKVRATVDEAFTDFVDHHMDYSEIAGNIDLGLLACELSLSDFVDEFDEASIAERLDYDRLADALDADGIVAAVAERIKNETGNLFEKPAQAVELTDELRGQLREFMRAELVGLLCEMLSPQIGKLYKATEEVKS